MCEFCTKHGEGKKWYLHMRNYSEILLHETLDRHQQDIAQVTTRTESLSNFFENTVMPAMGDLPKRSAPSPDVPPSSQPPQLQLSEDEIVARRKVSHFGQVLPIEDVEQVIDLADSITRMPCGCRFETTGKTDKRYCFGLGLDKWGVLGKFPDAAASLEVLDKTEAKRILREYDQEGLVHTVWSDIVPYVADLCNCDHDCVPYRRSIEKRGVPSFFRAEYICQVNWDLCSGCKSCMSQCQFGAQFYSSALSKVYIDPTRCFGCGVCRAACPQDAILAIPRQDHPQAANVWLKHEA